MILKITILICVFGFLISLDVAPERPEVEYYNQKYIRFLNLSIRRRSRHSPYYINLEFESYTSLGNNVTLALNILEQLSGGFQPTPLQMKYKLCDWFYKEPYLGQMYAKQLTGNWSCPLPAGYQKFKDLVIHLENFPFNIPFTSASVIIRTRADIEAYVTATQESVFRCKVYATVTQMPKKTKGNQVPVNGKRTLAEHI